MKPALAHGDSLPNRRLVRPELPRRGFVDQRASMAKKYSGSPDPRSRSSRRQRDSLSTFGRGDLRVKTEIFATREAAVRLALALETTRSGYKTPSWLPASAGSDRRDPAFRLKAEATHEV